MASTPEQLATPSTMATQIYIKIREDIINGVFPPGTHLVRRALAKRYGVSMLPVMEACLRLEVDGLVENSPQIGSHVVDVSPEKARDELILREALECQAAREYARNASGNDRRNLMEMAEFLDSIQEKLVPDNREHEKIFQKQHSEFHVTVARLSGANLIHEQMKKLWFRRLMLVCNVNSALFSNPKGWHVKLATALNSGDAETAENEMRAHILYNSEKSRDSVREVVRRGREELIDSILNGSKPEDDALPPLDH